MGIEAWGLDRLTISGRLFPVMKTMNWTVTEIDGKPVDALVDRGVIVGYVMYNRERLVWRLYRGDGELFFHEDASLGTCRPFDGTS